MKINVKKLEEKATLPLFATEGSAGSDLFACLPEPVCLPPGERTLIPTGLAIEIPESFGGFLFPRSSAASKHGITLSNCVGVIDSDYRGEVKIALINHSDKSYLINHGDRIAQLVIIPYLKPDFRQAAELGGTERGEGGFGSTGK